MQLLMKMPLSLLTDWIFLPVVLLVLSSCNYNYHIGQQLEKEGRFEEAHIEYQRAYNSDPEDDDFRTAYERTSKMTAIDLMLRYHRFLKSGEHRLAYRRLEQARTLDPENPEILAQQKHWHRILLAGKIDLQVKLLREQLPLSDEMSMEITFNTGEPGRVLTAPIDSQSRLFILEDILYDPSQTILLHYTVNSIGIRMDSKEIEFKGSAPPSSAGGQGGQVASDTSYLSSGYLTTGGSGKQKFIDFQIPFLEEPNGRLTYFGNDLRPVETYYPIDQLQNSKNHQIEIPRRIKSLNYSVEFGEQAIYIRNSLNTTAFLPQILYLNMQDRRLFLDFGHIKISQQANRQELWQIQREFDPSRAYLKELKKNLIVNPYLYYRDGAFPVLLKES